MQPKVGQGRDTSLQAVAIPANNLRVLSEVSTYIWETKQT